MCSSVDGALHECKGSAVGRLARFESASFSCNHPAVWFFCYAKALWTGQPVTRWKTGGELRNRRFMHAVQVWCTCIFTQARDWVVSSLMDSKKCIVILVRCRLQSDFVCGLLPDWAHHKTLTLWLDCLAHVIYVVDIFCVEAWFGLGNNHCFWWRVKTLSAVGTESSIPCLGTEVLWVSCSLQIQF